jgi:DNA-binding LacI/PurR family transcriptional regulator
MGTQAARLLIERLEAGEDADLPPRQVILQPTLYVGASVGPPNVS